MPKSLNDLYNESDTGQGGLQDIYSKSDVAVSSQSSQNAPLQISEKGGQPSGDLGMGLGEKAKLRAQLSTGNDPAQVQAWLEKKYPGREIKPIKGRKFSIDGIPIDPEGFSFSDLPFDIIDVSDEIVRLFGQMSGASKGALVGAPGGPVGVALGTIVGGGAGRALGEGVVEQAGRYFGLRDSGELGAVAKDIAIEGAIGATGEGVGLGVRAISGPSVKFLRGIFNQVQKKAAQPTVQNLFNFTSGVGKNSIARIQQRGANNVLTKSNMDDAAILRIGEKIQGAAQEKRTQLGKVVREGRGLIKGKIIADVDIKDLKQAYGEALQDIDLLNKNFKVLTPVIGKHTKEQKELLAIFEKLRTKDKISPNIALRLRNKLDDMLDFQGLGQRTISGREEAVAKGLRERLKTKLMAVSDTFRKANEDFSNFAMVDDALSGKLDFDKVENFLKNALSEKTAFGKEVLTRLNNQLSPDKRFMDELLDVMAARDFASGTFRGIRSGLIGGGLSTLGLPTPLAANLAIGVMVSTPKLVGELLRGQQATGRAIEALVRRSGAAGQKAAPKISSALLRRLLLK